MTARRLVAVLGLWAVGTSCGYSPVFKDCSVLCSDKGTCPAGLVCSQTYCRPANATGSCSCSPGDTRACGGGKGECLPGQQTCTTAGSWGSCLGEVKPALEICDNKDNDCNGTIDDNVTDAPACPLSKGVCAGHSPTCTAGVFATTCSPADYGPDYEAVETRCDSLDNDCDGIIDGTRSITLLSQLTHYALASSDGGFNLVGNLDRANGTHQVVLLPLTAALQPAGAMVTVSPLVTTEQVIAARSQGRRTFIAWADDAIDAGVHLSAVDTSGVQVDYPTDFQSEKTGALSLAVNGTKVLVTFPAHFSQAVRLVTWDTLDGGLSTQDFATLPDGGFGALNVYSYSRLSPTGRALAWLGIENDGGTLPDGGPVPYVSVSVVKELSGVKASSAQLGAGFELAEVGSTVQAAWNFSQYVVLPPFFNFDDSSVVYKADVFGNATETTPKTAMDHTLFTGTTIVGGVGTPVLGWTEKTQVAAIGVPIAAGTQVRQRTLPFGDGGYFFGLQLGSTGSNGMIAVTWKDAPTGAGTVSGMLVCQP